MDPSRLTRRQFLQTASLGSLAALAAPLWPGLPGFAVSDAGANRSATLPTKQTHLAWVWEFSFDGPARSIREVLAEHGLGVVLKTHDATTWMSAYDRSPEAVSGPDRVHRLASFFEAAGVPFHAWAVVRGQDVKKEAEMAAQVLDAGARSLTLDLEPFPGFWSAAPADAVAFGDALRSRQPNAFIATAFDPRPWVLVRVPLREFAAFSDQLAPMVYWESFNTRANLDGFALTGMRAQEVSAQLLLSLAHNVARVRGLPIQPVGEGSALQGWKDFVQQAADHAAPNVSVWRFGVTPPEVWGLLASSPPDRRWYVVQPGDTLGHLANEWQTSVSSIIRANDIGNPDLIFPGHRLLVPAG